MTKAQARKLITTITTLVLVVIFSYGASTTGVPNLQAGQYYVTQVDDGDTVQVRTGTGRTETIRFIGIDTPETRDPRKEVQCFGQAASNYTKQLLLGKTVRLEADPTGDDRDKYKRLLRYVYMEDGRHVNVELVKQGYAFAYTVFPNKFLEDFRAAEREARENNRGLWAGCTVNETEQIKQTNDAP